MLPPKLLETVVAHFHPRRVILFGSVARGEEGPDSDIDLVVELDDDIAPELMSAQSIQASREGYHSPVDIIPRCWHRAPAPSARARISCCRTG